MQPFVWFHNHSDDPARARKFYEDLLGWHVGEGPPGMTLFGSDKGPCAALGPSEARTGWLPYVEVPDVSAATTRAVELGAVLVQERTRGPAGEFAVVRDPGGAAVALWQKA